MLNRSVLYEVNLVAIGCREEGRVNPYLILTIEQVASYESANAGRKIAKRISEIEDITKHILQY